MAAVAAAVPPPRPCLLQRIRAQLHASSTHQSAAPPLQLAAAALQVEVLLALRGTLNVANLEDVYESTSEVHLVRVPCGCACLAAGGRTSRPASLPRAAAPRPRAPSPTALQPTQTPTQTARNPPATPPQVLEYCSGGELLSRAGKGARHYSERTAASFLRAVLRTLAQCHAKRIMHRDIKPENVRA